jgi:hypothetical protein
LRDGFRTVFNECLMHQGAVFKKFLKLTLRYFIDHILRFSFSDDLRFCNFQFFVDDRPVNRFFIHGNGIHCGDLHTNILTCPDNYRGNVLAIHSFQRHQDAKFRTSMDVRYNGFAFHMYEFAHFNFLADLTDQFNDLFIQGQVTGFKI